MIQNIWGQLRLLNNQGVLANLMAYGIGQRIFLDPANGADTNDGMAPTSVLGSSSGPVATLAQAFSLAIAGQNDMIILMANGSTSSTARLSTSFNWNKAQTHLIGYTPPVLFGQRARLAPPTTLAATSANTPFFQISAASCMFVNIEWYAGFSTGQAAQINVQLNASRCYFKNCQIAGITDAASAADTGSRGLKIGTATTFVGMDENLFEDCVIGDDTVSRSVANANLEFAASAARNVFRRCTFNSWATNAGVLHIIAGADGIDRFAYFDTCKFINFATALTKLGGINATQGGKFIFENPVLVNIPIFGDTANTIVLGPTPGAGAGIAVAPTA